MRAETKKLHNMTHESRFSIYSGFATSADPGESVRDSREDSGETWWPRSSGGGLEEARGSSGREVREARRTPGRRPGEVGRRPGRRPGGGQEEAGEASREDSREESREDSREEPGGGQNVVNSNKSEGGGSLSGSPPGVLRESSGSPPQVLRANGQ